MIDVLTNIFFVNDINKVSYLKNFIPINLKPQKNYHNFNGDILIFSNAFVNIKSVSYRKNSTVLNAKSIDWKKYKIKDVKVVDNFNKNCKDIIETLLYKLEHNDVCNVKITENYNDSRIDIYISGENRKKILSIISHNIEKISTSYRYILHIGETFEYKNSFKDACTKKLIETSYIKNLEDKESKYSLINENPERNYIKRIKIFLSSSNELENERRQFEVYIRRKNKMLINKMIYIDLELWEDFIEFMSKTRLQDEYNKIVKKCDIFVMLFFSKVGKFTLEEFEIAFCEYKERNKPFIYTYFKDGKNIKNSNKEAKQSLYNFEKRLEELGHFKSLYKNTEDLINKFNYQLDMMINENLI